MTIKELEGKTGLARANIRFYEQQGLLSPERKENGYRDYTEEDFLTLQKIKLLRHLGLGIEAIKAVQNREMPLSKAIAEREAELLKERAVLARQKAVCEELRMQNVEYQTLRPERYLLELEQEEKTAGSVQSVPKPEKYDIPTTLKHPFLRVFARGLDITLYGLVLPIFLIVLLKVFSAEDGILWLLGPGNLLYKVLCLAAIAVLMLLMEPLLLSRMGTTVGKALLGIRVYGNCGQKLSYGEAFSRTKGIVIRLLGLLVPIWNIYSVWKYFKDCQGGWLLPWEEGTVSTIKDTYVWRVLTFTISIIVLEVIGWLIGIQVVIPPNQGMLTKEEYVENCNYVAKLLQYEWRMNETGAWEEIKKPSMENVAVIELTDEIGVTHTVQTDESGYVTQVSFSAEEERTENWISLYTLEMQTAISNLALRTPEYGFLGMKYQMVFERIALGTQFSRSGTMDAGVVSMVWDVEMQGYSVSDDMLLLFPEEDAEEHGYQYTATLKYGG